MKNVLICLLTVSFIVSMIFIGTGCKEPEVIIETVTETVTETVVETVEVEKEEEVAEGPSFEGLDIAFTVMGMDMAYFVAINEHMEDIAAAEGFKKSPFVHFQRVWIC